jgi:outer membrane biosynthesis protein TonB
VRPSNRREQPLSTTEQHFLTATSNKKEKKSKEEKATRWSEDDRQHTDKDSDQHTRSSKEDVVTPKQPKTKSKRTTAVTKDAEQQFNQFNQFKSIQSIQSNQINRRSGISFFFSLSLSLCLSRKSSNRDKGNERKPTEIQVHHLSSHSLSISYYPNIRVKQLYQGVISIASDFSLFQIDFDSPDRFVCCFS